MPIAIDFDYVSTHTVQKAAGYISVVPALPQSSRLYVIHHTLANTYPYYIGTATNIQSRFTERLRTVREFGFRNNEIVNVSIAIVQIFVDGNPRPPGNLGISAGIDVENLLIRLYTRQNNGVRNIAKLAPFVNNHGQRLDCSLNNNAGWAHFVPANRNIAAGTAY